jgi:hypothetical protein
MVYAAKYPQMKNMIDVTYMVVDYNNGSDPIKSNKLHMLIHYVVNPI